MNDIEFTGINGLKLKENEKHSIGAQVLVVSFFLALVPIFIGTVVVNLGYERTGALIFAGVYLYPFGSWLFVNNFILKKETEKWFQKVGLFIVYLQVGLTYSWSLEMLFTGVVEQESFGLMLLKLAINAPAFILVGFTVGCFLTGALISSWVTF